MSEGRLRQMWGRVLVRGKVVLLTELVSVSVSGGGFARRSSTGLLCLITSLGRDI